MTTPTDAELDEFLDSPGNMNWVLADKRERFRLFARAVLAKWGQPQAGANGEPVTKERYSEPLARVINAGYALSNCAFNLAQRPGTEISLGTAQTLSECSKEWDAACAAHKALSPAPPPQAVREPHCWCLTCRPMRLDDPHSIRMSLCPTCGNKRCPKANDHRNTCTNSNEPGQPGSAYPGGITKGGQHGAE